MVSTPAGRAAFWGSWAGCSNVKFSGGRSKALPQGWRDPLQQKPAGQEEKAEGSREGVRRGLRSPPRWRRGRGHGVGSAWKRGDPVIACKYPVGEEGENGVPALCPAPCWAGAGRDDPPSKPVRVSP